MSITRIIRAGTGRASPGHGPAPAPRQAFLELGEGAARWLIEAAAAGAQRVRAKMARAVELAALVGAARVDQALGLAAITGRFADDDLPRDPGPPGGARRRPGRWSPPMRRTRPSPAPAGGPLCAARR